MANNKTLLNRNLKRVAASAAIRNKLAEKMKTQIVYMYNDDEQVYVKYTPGKSPVARRPGFDREAPVDAGSDISMHAVYEVTKKTYDANKVLRLPLDAL